MLRTAIVALMLSFCALPLIADAVVALPLNNDARDHTIDWIGESVAENILEAMHSEGLVVLDRGDRSEAYDRLQLRPFVPLSRASVVKIADELGASHAVYGSFVLVRHSDPAIKPTLRLTARVLDLRNLRQSAALAEEGPLEELATLQNKLAWQALCAIVPGPATTADSFLSRRPKIRVDAMENYVRGLMARDASARHRFFTQAARLDTSFSQPSFQLGLQYWDNEDYQQAATWFLRVGRRDPHFSEATFYLAICRHHLGQFTEAESGFRTVAAVVPLNEVFNNLGASQLRQGKYAEAVSNLEKALEGDPADPAYHFNLGYALWHAKRFEEAADRFRAVLERIPDDQEATAILGFCLRKNPPRVGNTKYEGLERLKAQYEETVFRQLKSMVEKK